MMKKWEYKNRTRSVPFIGEETLNELGKEGWELVSVVSYNGSSAYYFKREIKED